MAAAGVCHPSQPVGIAHALLGGPEGRSLHHPSVGPVAEKRARLRRLLGGVAARRVVRLSTRLGADAAPPCKVPAGLEGGGARFARGPEAPAARAQARVWEMRLSRWDHGRRAGDGQVAARRAEDHLPVLRALSGAPAGGPVSPTPGDGYQQRMGGRVPPPEAPVA